MNTKNVVRAAGGFVLAGTLFLGGCGYKNAPVPPQTVVPEAVEDLLYTVDDKGIKLTWSYPVKTVKGSVVEEISSFDLYRAEVPLEEYCGGCPVPFGEPIELAGGASVDGEQRRTATYVSSMVQSGYKYFFKVRSRSSWLAASGDSNIITFVWYQPAAAPEGVAVSSGDRQVSFKWQPVTLLSDGTALDKPIKYQVLRSDGGKGLVKVGEPITGTSFVDKQVRNGQKYFYAVQSLMQYQDEFIVGGTSKEIGALPVDLTPPLPPSGVTAVATSVGVKIFWDKSDTADLGGYIVYKRAANKDSYELLGKVESEFSLFVDRSTNNGVRRYYAVTAIDRATPPNESDKSREATVRY
ncbi:MAG: hypothetical protein GY702_11340 [Desulfobulbaceae bacterium]|nr:hypothetical protein [Desulfobulbaceae bacterium]